MNSNGQVMEIFDRRSRGDRITNSGYEAGGARHGAGGEGKEQVNEESLWPRLEGIGFLRVLMGLEDGASRRQYFAFEIEEPEYGHWRDWIFDALREMKI